MQIKCTIRRKVMKKFLAICLALMIMLSFAACDESGNEQASLTPTPTATELVENQHGEGTPTPTIAAGDEASLATPTPTISAGNEAPVQTTTPTNAPANVATAKPTEAPHQHTWSDWKKETKAYVGKAGTDKRVCSTCSATETRVRTENAIYNSFYCFGYQYVLSKNNTINAYDLVSFASAEFGDYARKPTPVATIVQELKKHFNIDANMEAAVIQAMKTFNYNAQKDEITLEARAESAEYFILKGYKHLGGNKYATYYSFSGFDIFEPLNELYKVEIEYNRENGKPNKLISTVLVDSLPNDMVVCSDGQRYEYQ